ncbi:MAG TPA: hypothetical protein VKH19_19145 [Gemmatimonadaceae bacterium]|nr:hypothetical protein [Gemmatimonadaceae bacterium]
MRQTRQLSIAALSIAVGLAACSSGKSTAQQDDFANDLRLAQSSALDLAQPKVDPSLLNSSLENKPTGSPQVATTLKKNSAGTHVVSSRQPTVHAAPTTDVAASDDVSREVVTIEEAPAPDVSEPVAVAPRSVPGPTPGAGDNTGDYGTSGNGGGIFGPGGGMGGVVIRGGGADGDHCEIHGTGRGRTGPIFIPTRGVPVMRPTTQRPSGTGGIGTRRPGGGSTVSRPGGTVSRGRRG